MMDGDDAKYQPLLEALVPRVSELVDRWFGYPLGSFKADSATAKYFDGNGELEIWPGNMAAAPATVEVAEAGDITDYTLWDSTDYMLRPYNALAEGLPYRSLFIDQLNGSKWIWYKFPQAVKITAKWGWSEEVPHVIAEACIVQCARWFKRGQQAFQDAGAVTELMQMRYLKKIDPEVEMLLSRMPGGITI
jgi:hypothetical protein